MIKVENAKRPTVREAKSQFTYTNDNGDLVAEEIRVRYFSVSISQLKKAAEAEKQATKKGETPWISSVLAQQIESLPDIVDDKGKPVEVTEELLEGWDIDNLIAMLKAIRGDTDPKSQPNA